jgi:coenzyme Q-binding protein COQ10
MKTSHLERVLPYKQEHLYQVITDVGSYPEFIPWCKKCCLMATYEDGSIIAEMEVGFKGVFASYHSHITCVPFSQVIVEGQGDLFHHLKTMWTLKALGASLTHVSFDLEFVFKSPIMQTLAGSAFEMITLTIMEAFEVQAQKTLGRYDIRPRPSQ